MTPEQERERLMLLARARKRASDGQSAPAEGQPAAQPDNRPWYAQAGEAADDIMRIVADSATFGYADKFASWAGGTPLEQERARTAEARRRAGWAGTVGDVAGALAPVAALPSAVGKARSLGKLLVGAAEGAGYGALNAAGHDTDLTEGALTGAAGGVAGVALGSAVEHGAKAVGQGYKRLTGQAPKVPSTKELEALAGQAYQAADDAGVMLSRNGLVDLRDKVQTALTDFGYHPRNHPAAATALSELNRLAKGHATLKGMETARKIAIRGYKPGDKEGNAALRLVVDSIDDHIAALKDTPGYVLDGNGRQGAEALEQARSLWARKAKAESVEQAITRADRSAATQASGGNTENRTRQEVRKLLEKARGWTPDERALAEEVARGTPVNNALRLAGRLSPQGNGVGIMFGLGGLTSASPEMLTGTALGAVAKPLSTKMTNAKAKKLAELMRAGGAEVLRSGPPNALQRTAKPIGRTVERALLAAALARMNEPAR